MQIKLGDMNTILLSSPQMWSISFFTDLHFIIIKHKVPQKIKIQHQFSNQRIILQYKNKTNKINHSNMKLDDSAFFQTQSYITEICYFEYLLSLLFAFFSPVQSNIKHN